MHLTKSRQNDYDVLLSTDRISEGFNLNRAGMVINYDIPWNPVRVIQRVGRINRISKKVFDDLFIVNFFPTEQGALLVQSRQIASNKMFLIHETLVKTRKYLILTKSLHQPGYMKGITESGRWKRKVFILKLSRNIWKLKVMTRNW